ncbi:hypothetical protein KR767_04115 [Luteibacter anthropi]|uniref:phage minor head protein n=1 Tax=Luteibacter anthropi TaxID=564369 RepID=UPI002032C26D|nr:phage minor head protein [Luteibacter anthropi]URX63262.1 hypothetical protein KR767_04115 [Luteibacter anthropi]
MDPEERVRRFLEAAEAEIAFLPRIQKDTLAELVKQLEIAEQAILDALRSSTSVSAQLRLRRMRDEVERALEDFRQAVTSSTTAGAQQAWEAGIRTIAAPFDAAGVSILGPSIDRGALMATQRFLTNRISDISLRAVNQLNGALIQNIVGATPLSDTVTLVQRILGGAPRSRAMTVAYTEIGRAHSVSQNESLQQAGDIVPNLHKRWLKSGKLHPRASHVHAHNQIRRYDEPYVVGGESLMFPRDPDASAENSINCGCHSIPVVDGSSFGSSTIQISPQGIVRKIVLPR